MWSIVAEGFSFLEAPRAGPDGELYFSDLRKGGIYRRTPDGRLERFLEKRRWIGGAVIDEGGGLILSGEGGLILFDPATLRQTPLLTAPAGVAAGSVNDIEADRSGAIYGGTVDFAAVMDRGEPPRSGVFFRLSRTGDLEIVRENVRLSNGIAFSPADDILYHAESGVGIWSYDVPRDGSLPQSPRLMAAVEDCDGLAVDTEGAIWCARWRRGRLCRYAPDGQIEQELQFPWQVASIAFGGSDLRTLYVATGAPLKGEGSAALLSMQVPVPGLRPHRSGIDPKKYNYLQNWAGSL